MSTKPVLGAPPQRDAFGHFLPGNGLALKTGAYSLATVRERSMAIREQLQAHLDSHLQHLTAADQPMVDLAVNVLTKLALIEEYLQRTSGGSLLDGRGVERNASKPYFELVRTALRVFRELGIGPRARSEILASLGFAADRKQTVVAAAQARLRAKHDQAIDVEPIDGD